MAKNNTHFKAAVGLLFLIDFSVTIAILFTDSNLQTDFGLVPKYFIHWYGLLATAIVDLTGAAVIFTKPSRRVFSIGLAGSSLLALFLVIDVLTYQMVGFSSITSFASYLFGVTKYPGSLGYIPGLYDALLFSYVITSLTSALAMRRFNSQIN